MKRLRAGVMVALTIGLLIGSSVGVVGQDETADMSVVRGTFVDWGSTTDGNVVSDDASWSDDAISGTADGWR